MGIERCFHLLLQKFRVTDIQKQFHVRHKRIMHWSDDCFMVVEFPAFIRVSWTNFNAEKVQQRTRLFCSVLFLFQANFHVILGVWHGVPYSHTDSYHNCHDDPSRRAVVPHQAPLGSNTVVSSLTIRKLSHEPPELSSLSDEHCSKTQLVFQQKTSTHDSSFLVPQSADCHTCRAHLVSSDHKDQHQKVEPAGPVAFSRTKATNREGVRNSPGVRRPCVSGTSGM